MSVSVHLVILLTDLPIRGRFLSIIEKLKTYNGKTNPSDQERTEIFQSIRNCHQIHPNNVDFLFLTGMIRTHTLREWVLIYGTIPPEAKGDDVSIAQTDFPGTKAGT